MPNCKLPEPGYSVQWDIFTCPDCDTVWTQVAVDLWVANYDEQLTPEAIAVQEELGINPREGATPNG